MTNKIISKFLIILIIRCVWKTYCMYFVHFRYKFFLFKVGSYSVRPGEKPPGGGGGYATFNRWLAVQGVAAEPYWLIK